MKIYERVYRKYKDRNQTIVKYENQLINLIRYRKELRIHKLTNKVYWLPNVCFWKDMWRS